MHPNIGRLTAIVLTVLLLAASGAPCKAAPLNAGTVVKAFDPCREIQAPSSQCARISCNAFAMLETSTVRPVPVQDPVPFHAFAADAANRFIRPPLPPPRISMI